LEEQRELWMLLKKDELFDLRTEQNQEKFSFKKIESLLLLSFLLISLDIWERIPNLRVFYSRILIKWHKSYKTKLKHLLVESIQLFERYLML